MGRGDYAEIGDSTPNAFGATRFLKAAPVIQSERRSGTRRCVIQRFNENGRFIEQTFEQESRWARVREQARLSFLLNIAFLVYEKIFRAKWRYAFS